MPIPLPRHRVSVNSDLEDRPRRLYFGGSKRVACDEGNSAFATISGLFNLNLSRCRLEVLTGTGADALGG